MRRKILVGNWKMYKTESEARSFAEALGREANKLVNTADYAVCPPFTALHILRVLLPAQVKTGSQNLHFEANGAFTGEISAAMVKELGATYAIVGHSERRSLFGETDDFISKKVKTAVEEGLTPILCVGENAQEREANQTLDVVKQQTIAGLSLISHEQTKSVVIAYEPVWAIGSGVTPSSVQAEEVIAEIRKVVSGAKGTDAADVVRILYGGSVKPQNIASFVAEANIDGALVGGASLEASSFAGMAEAMAGGSAS